MIRIWVALLALVASLPGAAVTLAQTPAPAEAPTSAATDMPPGVVVSPDPPVEPAEANPGRTAMYRWIDKDGVLNYSDTPPQPGATSPAPKATRAPGGGAKDRK